MVGTSQLIIIIIIIIQNLRSAALPLGGYRGAAEWEIEQLTKSSRKQTSFKSLTVERERVAV